MDERPVERGPVVALTASRWCCRGSGGSNDRGGPGGRGAGARLGCDACNPGGGPARPGGVREATVPDDGAAGPEPAVTRWAATGDFDAFVRARYSALLRFAHALTGDHELAADLVQDALERTGVAWSRVRRRDDPERYARRIIVTRYVSTWRRRWRERLLGAVPEACYDTPPAADPTRPGGGCSRRCHRGS